MYQNTNNSQEKKAIKSNSLKKTDKIFENRYTKKFNLLSSEQINFFIKNLSSPRFLGSIHIKQETNHDPYLIESVINKNLEYKLSRTLKSPLNNPVTKFLLLLMIFFNIFWIIFIYVL